MLSYSSSSRMPRNKLLHQSIVTLRKILKKAKDRRTRKTRQEKRDEKATMEAADKLSVEKLAADKLAADKLAKELLDQVNKVPAKENPAKEPTAAEPVLEVILIEDELIDAAREPTRDQVIPNINDIDNLDSIINVTDDYSFNLDNVILRRRPFPDTTTMATNKKEDKTRLSQSIMLVLMAND